MKDKSMIHRRGFLKAIPMVAAPLALAGCKKSENSASGKTAPKNEATAEAVDTDWKHTQINICEAPYFADPTGKKDCTEAILQALDDMTNLTRTAMRQTMAEMEKLPSEGEHHHPYSYENRRSNGEIFCVTCSHLPYVPVLYFPEGTYLVSDTLCYRHKDLINTYGSPMSQQIRLRGAGVGRTVIRLTDRTEGFGKGTRKPVISYMPGEGSNVATSNYCEDLTINCGTGNPGAVGLDFFTNNSGAVRNIQVLSDDGLGHAGVQLGHGNYSGVLIKHVEVKGFDHGLHVDSTTATMFAHAEDITTSGQRVSGITMGAISLSLRHIKTSNVPVAVTCTHAVGFMVLLDSVLTGTGPVAIDRKAGFLYVSNVETKGFDDSRHIDEWVHPRAFGETEKGKGMPRLPIEETPIWKPSGKTTGIRTHGAIGNESNDDSPAIQRALDSGATEIRFEPGRYLMNTPVTIPSHVEHIDFSFCDLVAGIDLKQSKREGFVIAGKKSDRTLFVERLLTWERWSGEHCTFTHASQRTVCFKDMQTQSLQIYRNTVSGAKVFFDNVAMTTGIRPGTDIYGRCCASFKGQKVWARQLNPERGQPMVINDGGDLVIMGYKSEGRGIIVHTINGGRTEVLGGIMNVGRDGEIAFVVEDSQLRVSTASQNRHPGGFYRTAVRSIQKGKTTTLEGVDLPLRSGPKASTPQFVIPLYTT
ncbi:MAG: glycosyl hydrolase family 28-related protein [Akkermansiaceae bacterium]